MAWSRAEIPECGAVSREMRLDRQTGPVEALEDRTLTFGIEEVGIICVCWGGCLNEMHFKKMTLAPMWRTE